MAAADKRVTMPKMGNGSSGKDSLVATMNVVAAADSYDLDQNAKSTLAT
jgi:L-cysteine desulfidase